MSSKSPSLPIASSPSLCPSPSKDAAASCKGDAIKRLNTNFLRAIVHDNGHGNSNDQSNVMHQYLEYEALIKSTNNPSILDSETFEFARDSATSSPRDIDALIEKKIKSTPEDEKKVAAVMDGMEKARTE